MRFVSYMSCIVLVLGLSSWGKFATSVILVRWVAVLLTSQVFEWTRANAMQ